MSALNTEKQQRMFVLLGGICFSLVNSIEEMRSKLAAGGVKLAESVGATVLGPRSALNDQDSAEALNGESLQGLFRGAFLFRRGLECAVDLIISDKVTDRRFFIDGEVINRKEAVRQIEGSYEASIARRMYKLLEATEDWREVDLSADRLASVEGRIEILQMAAKLRSVHTQAKSVEEMCMHYANALGVKSLKKADTIGEFDRKAQNEHDIWYKELKKQGRGISVQTALDANEAFQVDYHLSEAAIKIRFPEHFLQITREYTRMAHEAMRTAPQREQELVMDLIVDRNSSLKRGIEEMAALRIVPAVQEALRIMYCAVDRQQPVGMGGGDPPPLSMAHGNGFLSRADMMDIADESDARRRMHESDRVVVEAARGMRRKALNLADRVIGEIQYSDAFYDGVSKSLTDIRLTAEEALKNSCVQAAGAESVTRRTPNDNVRVGADFLTKRGLTPIRSGR